VLATQERLTKAKVPVPVKAAWVEESTALLAKDSVAEGLPLFAGVKATLRDALPPAGTVNGNGASSTAN
jgi:hypothetical protein